jgi:tetratricopeptide (TPR) repeat protein
MNDRLAKAEAIFHDALELPPEQRETFVQKTCGEDADLRHEVAALLQAAGIADRWLHEPGQGERLPGRSHAEAGPREPEGPGTRIGRYKLLEQIGEGGFGVVYMAEQQEPVRRRVALKIIKVGMDTRSVVARFEAERQALALMDHPNIAKVLDGGATELGRPYFVMELVRGVPITEFCDQNRLTNPQRLDLFVQVCAAVQHAHHKGVIHRDLKPSNVLVTMHDDRPVPKIIDFGIAKATEHRLTEKTLFTRFHQFIGTPAYMSPEQTGISGLDVDTRSDIYSLGVLLYELLAGRTPFDTKALLEAGYEEIQRTIREKEPPSMSHRLSALSPDELTTTAQRRRVEPLGLGRELRGDLDWIVMKCLEKDRTRRYETANLLALDIGRHLAQEPVTACPPGAAYRFGKFVRRNKFAFAAGTAVAAALIAGLATALLALARERAANERAEQQRRLAEQRMLVAVRHVEGFLTNDLMELRRLPGSTRPMERMLDNTLAFMDALAPVRTDHPEFLLASARIHAALGWAQGSKWGMSLGKPEAALASASNAWSLLQAIPVGALSATRRREITFLVEEASGMALEALGREDEALEHYRRMLPLAAELDRDLLPRPDGRPWSATAHVRLAALYMIKSELNLMREETDHLLRDPYFLTNTASGDLGRLWFTDTALFLDGIYYSSVSNWIAALHSLRQGLAVCEAYLERSNADQLMEYYAALHLSNIGRVLSAQGNHVEGIRARDEALRRQEVLANRDKENWVFQDLLTQMRLGSARARVAASKQTGLPLTERVRLLEEARDRFKHSLDWMQALSNSTRMKSWVDAKPGDIARELSELESELARLKAALN